MPHSGPVNWQSEILVEIERYPPLSRGKGAHRAGVPDPFGTACGHPLDLERLNPTAIFEATIASFSGKEAPLVKVIRELLTRSGNR